ncbi:hypothetical protein [Coleofasciculus sp. F4-SAH-05]|uniref:hypothetical protein n=1 Tax=Coleofasciculus sp. F4-SAH-05 TaxID=3069525 RepID=UPI0033038589
MIVSDKLSTKLALDLTEIAKRSRLPRTLPKACEAKRSRLPRTLPKACEAKRSRQRITPRIQSTMICRLNRLIISPEAP